MKKIKHKSNISVTHITTVHPPFDTRIFYKECKSLVNHGVNVNLIVSHDKEETIEGVHIIPLPFFKRRMTRMLIKPILALSIALRTRANLYHFHDPELIPLGILLKLCGKKVIYDVHEDVSSQILSKHWIAPSLRHSISLAVNYIEVFFCRFFDGIVAATPHINNKFSKINKNVIDINNYPILEEFINVNKDQESDKKQERIICYVGGITKERGIFELLKSIEGTDIKLYLAGTPSPNNLLKVLEKEKGWKNVIYFGQVSREQVSTILSKSSIGIVLLHPLANYLESLPVKLFEYMCAGLPVIASKFSYWEEFLQATDNVYFVDPLNPEAIKLALKTLLSDQEKRSSMGARGLKAVKEQYNWALEEIKFINFYRQLGIFLPNEQIECSHH